jgi:DNA-directed RNA polymerase subunit omega
LLDCILKEGKPVARITVEDCLKKTPNQLELVRLATERSKQLIKGAQPLVKSDNQEVVLALREIAAGKVRKASKELSPCRNPIHKMLTRGVRNDS